MHMERLLHITLRVHTMAAAAAWVCASSGCVLPPDIEPEPAQINYAPYIDRTVAFPDAQVVRVETQDPIVLRVTEVLDPNPEERLYFAWFGRTSGLLQSSTLRRISDEPDATTGFYVFEGTERTIDPCDDRFSTVQNETIWLYVSDRDFAETGNNGVFEQEGQYKVALTWALEFNVFCGIN